MVGRRASNSVSACFVCVCVFFNFFFSSDGEIWVSSLACIDLIHFYIYIDVYYLTYEGTELIAVCAVNEYLESISLADTWL